MTVFAFVKINNVFKTAVTVARCSVAVKKMIITKKVRNNLYLYLYIYKCKYRNILLILR